LTTIRLCFIGDSITTGTGDFTMLGFPGRLCAAAANAGHNITLYNLGVRGDTSEDVYRRWRIETQPRMLPTTNNALVFMLGLNDSMILDTGQSRVPLARTLAACRALMSEAKAYLPSLFIGPAPIDDTRRVPGLPLDVHYQFFNAKISEINNHLTSISSEIGVPFLDVFTPLANSDEWSAIMRKGDGVHPPADGYEKLTALISVWASWRLLFSDR
jgi:lysophospholipase L1-like esterase